MLITRDQRLANRLFDNCMMEVDPYIDEQTLDKAIAAATQVSFIFYGMLKIFRPVVGEVVREMSINELKDEYRKTLSVEKAHGG
nr:protein FORGETTER 1 isoform X2 [Tanacetum cinerariifolium]